MHRTLYEIAAGSKFQKVVRTGMVLVIGLMFFVEPLTVLAEQWPILERALMGYLSILPLLIAFGVVLLLPGIFAYVKSVKNGAPIFSTPKSDYRPWPAHSHPVARTTAWGGLYPDDDVTSRRTGLKLIGQFEARQTILLKRKLIVLIFLLVGVALVALPFVAKALVYEITPPHIEGLQKMAREMAPLFIIPGALIGIASLCMMWTKIPIVYFKLTDGTVHFRKSRFLGMFDRVLKSSEDTVPISDIAGLQLISYRSKGRYGHGDGDRGSRITQLEFNLVFKNGKRRLIAKQPETVSFPGKQSHKALLNDAVMLANFLQIPVWDRCGYYQPNSMALLQPVDPLIQSL